MLSAVRKIAVVHLLIQQGLFKGVKSLTILLLLLPVFSIHAQDTISSHIRKKAEVGERISPKSIVTNQQGIFAAQNMMYRHTITLYNKRGEHISTINDGVNLHDLGYTEYANASYLGAPVEGVFTDSGKYLWVSNYEMNGPGFNHPGCDQCIGENYDPGFLYKIDWEAEKIDTVVRVGAVPKFLAVSPDGNLLLASNWVSSDVSIIDLNTNVEVKRVSVGPHPRGIAISTDSQLAYVTIMGSSRLAEINLENFDVQYIENIGRGPRSVNLSPSDSILYVSLNNESAVVAYNRFTHEKKRCKTPGGPRSMTLSPDGKQLYVVNYFSDSFSKIRTDSMTLVETIPTKPKPIGICADWNTAEIWVACYSGTLEIYKDFALDKALHPEQEWLGVSWPNWLLEGLALADTVSSPSQGISPPTKIEEIEEAVAAPTAPAQYEARIPLEKRIHPPLHDNPNLPCTYHLIVGAFSIPENANRRKTELEKKGLTPSILAGTKLNYVSVDCFTSRSGAETAKAGLLEENPEIESAWILVR